MKFIKKAIIASLTVPFLTLAQVQTIIPRSGLTQGNVVNTLNFILTWVIGIVSIVAVIMLVYSGYLFMTGGADEEARTKAKDYLKYGLIGIAVVILSYSGVTFINSLIQ